MPPFLVVILVIIVISTVVGALAKFLNNLNEMQAARNRPAPRADDGGGNAGAGARAGGGGGGAGGTVRQSNTDMDRFLAEIDRLRKKNAETPPPAPGHAAPVAPVVQPAKQPDRPRPRVVAEPAEAPRPDTGFAALPPPPTGPKAGDLPMATVVRPPSGTGAPATRVTRIAGRARPVAKTDLARNLTNLLNSGQGLALAVVLQEILGPPKCQTNSAGPPPRPAARQPDGSEPPAEPGA